MRDRSEQLLRWLGCILIALICFQVLRAGCRANPFARLHLPPVPTLQTNAVASAATNGAPNQPNQPPTAGAPTINHVTGPGTNNVAVITNTNTPASTNSQASVTNAVTNAVVVAGDTTATNSTSGSTNNVAQTNSVASSSTNAPGGTNTLATISTNAVGVTNKLAAAPTNAPGTNIVRSAGPAHPPHGGPMPMMGGMPFMGGGFPGMPGMGGPPTPLPKEIQARVDKIVDSEIFAPVMRPLPMQLFGIAGNTAMLRTASGESGLVKEGDSLGSVKLLRIGINRVLVDDNGQMKELMIFDGYGGESLMPKTNEASK